MKSIRLWGTLVLLLVFQASALAQPAPEPAPPPDPAPAPEMPPEPAPPPEPEPEPDPVLPNDPAHPPVSATGLRVHVISTRNTYVPMKFDVFAVDTRQLVASGAGAMESRGEEAPVLELRPGLYKIVRAGEPFEARADYAIALVEPEAVTDYVIVVDPDSLEFRASGPQIGELPRGREIAGIRISLNGGGNLMFNQRRVAIGNTSGTTAQFGMFGNFGMVYDKGDHFVDLNAEMQLDLFDPVTGSIWPTHDRFQAAALYSFKLNNPYFGPYVRASMRTRIFPGYLYLERTNPVMVEIHRLDGTIESSIRGLQANPDDLRIKVAQPFAPFRLQEELGANVKAIDLDLLLIKLHVATRLGFGFRQGFMNGLLVPRGANEDASPLILREVDNYTTLGPVLGANASVTFARWLFGSAQFGVLAPLTNRENAGRNFGGQLLVDFSGTAGFKVPILTDLLYASADYTFRLERDGFIVNNTQFEHQLMARANITLF
jgi:hypothetical protein